ncbi:MAG TPA: TRZ/ATZ family hydrolase [Methylococcaceae bacterium]|nr:TRZ/ATZ family hydrolase [Methylococcaceae bacterium]
MNPDCLLLARWIIPVEPEGVVLKNHALVLAGGRIAAVLPRDAALADYPDLPTEVFDQHALIPGLINAHSHAAMNLLRGVADDLPLMDWLQNHIWPLESRWVGEAFVRDGTDLALAEMLRGGVTCCNDMYFFPDVFARRALRAGVRAAVGLILIDFPSAWAGTADEYFTKGLALRDELRGEPLLHPVFAPHAPYTVSDASLRRVGVLAGELDLPIHMHLHETRDEVDQGLKTHGMRPLQRLEQLELLSPQFIGVHMTQLDDAEIARYGEFGASAVHCPESNLKLASGFCPVAKLLGAGINVALGTDGAASNNDLDMLGEMRTAALLAKAVAGDARAVPARTALRMATLNGAKALGLESETGSLAPGKSADIAAIRLDALETQPLFDPISQIVYAAGREHVTDVWVAGRRLLRQRELTTLDEADLLERARHWREKLVSSFSPRDPA